MLGWRGYKFLCKKMVATFLPKSPCKKTLPPWSSPALVRAAPDGQWFRWVNRPFPTWNPHGEYVTTPTEVMKWDWCIQHWKTWRYSTWNMIGLLFSHQKILENPANLRYFWDIPPGHAGWDQLVESLQLGNLFRYWWLQGFLSQTLLVRKKCWHWNPPNHQTSKLFRLFVFLLLVGQKHPQVRCLTSRPMIFLHIYLPISKSGTP